MICICMYEIQYARMVYVYRYIWNVHVCFPLLYLLSYTHLYARIHLHIYTGIYWSWNGGARTVAYKDLKNLSGKPVGAGGSGICMYI